MSYQQNSAFSERLFLFLGLLVLSEDGQDDLFQSLTHLGQLNISVAISLIALTVATLSDCI